MNVSAESTSGQLSMHFLNRNILGNINFFLKEFNTEEKITILMVTHSPMAAEFGNFKIKLSNGELVKDLKNQEVLN